MVLVNREPSRLFTFSTSKRCSKPSGGLANRNPSIPGTKSGGGCTGSNIEVLLAKAVMPNSARPASLKLRRGSLRFFARWI
jgi:hypothetical protein